MFIETFDAHCYGYGSWDKIERFFASVSEFARPPFTVMHDLQNVRIGDRTFLGDF